MRTFNGGNPTRKRGRDLSAPSLTLAVSMWSSCVELGVRKVVHANSLGVSRRPVAAAGPARFEIESGDESPHSQKGQMYSPGRPGSAIPEFGDWANRWRGTYDALTNWSVRAVRNDRGRTDGLGPERASHDYSNGSGPGTRTPVPVRAAGRFAVRSLARDAGARRLVRGRTDCGTRCA